jgi:hypothetical protein
VNSTSDSTEPEIVSTARAKAEYIGGEMMAEFKRLDAGETKLTPEVVQTFERKWTEELKELDNRIFAAEMSPASVDFVPTLQKMRDELKGFIDTYVKALTYHYVPEGSEAPAETPEEEKARKRAERKARMKKYERGEKPD